MFKWLTQYLEESKQRREIEIAEADDAAFIYGRRYVRFQLLLASLEVSQRLWRICSKKDTAFTRGMQAELEANNIGGEDGQQTKYFNSLAS